MGASRVGRAVKCAVVIPVGPGHEAYALTAVASVSAAWKADPGPFDELEFAVVWDRAGALGRSKARNKAMDEHPADFHFLLDADDLMLPSAFSLVVREADATFGAIMLDRQVFAHNEWPVTRETLFAKGAKGTLAMGCFVRGDLGLRFNEAMDVAEDYDFYLRLPSFVKIRQPLVSIGYSKPSATGPRGYEKIDWIGECNRVIGLYAQAEQ